MFFFHFPNSWLHLYFICMDFSARPKVRDAALQNGESSKAKKQSTTIDDVLKGLVDWLCAQVCLQFRIRV